MPVPQRKPTDEIARQRQAEMKSTGITRMLIGAALLLGGVVGIIYVSFSTLGIVLELGALVLGTRFSATDTKNTRPP